MINISLDFYIFIHLSVFTYFQKTKTIFVMFIMQVHNIDSALRISDIEDQFTSEPLKILNFLATLQPRVEKTGLGFQIHDSPWLLVTYVSYVVN